ncbi:MAG: DUF3631 domain-containing protein [Rhodocyclaceae bacterium]
MIVSADLLQALCDDEESPWATWNRGKPIQLRQLSRKLAEFGIKSKDVRQGYEVKKGYHLEQFADAFERYLCTADSLTSTNTLPASATPLHLSGDAASSVAQSTTAAPEKILSATRKAPDDKVCSVVADKSTLTSEEAASAQFFGGEV